MGMPSGVDDRDKAAEERDQAGGQRDQAADQRDRASDQRDQAADQRDEAADRRDQAAERSEASTGALTTTNALSPPALARRDAASDRRRASQDRRAEARARTEAELDRDTALADRGASAKEREHASFDDLTGVYQRGAGFVELEREMARTRRMRQPLVLAFVDVDGLKVVNDSRGHAAGDQMLIEVADTLRASLRPHDLIIRYGGDEFVYAVAGVKAADVINRLARVSAALAEAPAHGSVSVGVAQMRAGDSAEALVARGDAALYRERRWQRSRA